METVQRNAQQSLVLHKTKRASDLTTRSRALEEIAEALELESAPLRIECYDISHFQGDDVVASMVVFEDGLARKSEYRRFQIKGRAYDTQLWHGQGQDDVRSMHEVITRRFRRYLSDRERTGEWTEEQDATEGGEVTASLTDEDGRPKRFAYPPQLVVVDGGQPQVAAAQRALDELGIDDIAVCGLAKRLEEVWVPGQDDPVVLPAPARASTSSSASATRPTASPSPTSGPSAPSASAPAPSTTSPASARPANRPWSSTSARSANSAPPPSSRSARSPA